MTAKRPAYVDSTVPEAGLRRRHSITSRHEPRIARAFGRITSGIIDTGTRRELIAAIGDVEEGKLTVDGALEVVEWFNPADPLASKKWELLGASANRAYVSLMEDTGAGEVNEKRWPLRFTVAKAQDIRVPTNPWSQKWADERSAQLVQQISDGQRILLRQLISERLAEGLRPKEILEEIERIVGLTEREWRAVIARDQLLAQGGMVDTARVAAVERYSKQLHRKRGKRIARTETIEAYSQGLEDTWQMAKEEGLIEQPLKEWVELTSSPRTCKICRGLARQRVPVGEPFVSDIIGEIQRPPAHSHCRCTLFLVDEDDFAEDNAPIDQARLDAQQARETLAGG